MKDYRGILVFRAGNVVEGLMGLGHSGNPLKGGRENNKQERARWYSGLISADCRLKWFGKQDFEAQTSPCQTNESRQPGQPVPKVPCQSVKTISASMFFQFWVPNNKKIINILRALSGRFRNTSCNGPS